MIVQPTSSDIKRFNRSAATYDQSIMQRLFFGPVHTKILDLLSQGCTTTPPDCIIDIGRGTGRLLHLASVRWSEAELFGVDPAEQMVSQARRHNPNATFKHAQAESLPLPNQIADVVLSSISFHHWIDPIVGLSEHRPLVLWARPAGCLQCPGGKPGVATDSGILAYNIWIEANR